MIIIILLLISWTITGAFICYGLKKEDIIDPKSAKFTDAVRGLIFIVLCGPFVWAIFIYLIYRDLLNKIIPKK